MIQMKKMQYVVASLLAASVFTTAAEAANFNNEVKTQQGVVAGAYDDKHQVVQWLGVPYAQQPTGADRWREAQQAKKHKGILDCTKAAPANIQYNGKKVLGQEGMLTLDIVRPDTQEKNLPVLVYIHGGNNQASNSHLMEGNRLAQEGNMVYVSVQYRLGLFGFNNLPALADGNKKEQSGNFGFLDQAAALDWVRENIKEFGGDAKNITVSGFSAGGRDVMAMLISPVFKNKFDKAISFSGGLTVADAAKSQKTIAQKLAPMVVEDGKQNNLINAEHRRLLSVIRTVELLTVDESSLVMTFYLVSKLWLLAVTFLYDFILKTAWQYFNAFFLSVFCEEINTVFLHDFSDLSLFCCLFFLKLLEILIQNISSLLI